ncbi:glycosyltransferase [Cellulosimicrobium marinum]|uniref:glycosyltransferase n=1 Tax=Cellulosimicrobium marinum TaxID=1638992 RepID=UPI001E3BCF8D|nr:glycosyltransferase [Cellulosimicrobium marinum]MCB7137190.1 glycosyltransferase [Cellulosimicrobium marinum]
MHPGAAGARADDQEQLHVFMVVGILGKGGMTAAMLNRARMFVEHGIPTTVVTLQHDPDHALRNAEYLEMGWLDPRVRVLNAFKERRASHRTARFRGRVRDRVATKVRAPRGSRSRTDPATGHEHFVDTRETVVMSRARRDDGTVSWVRWHTDGPGADRVVHYDRDGSALRECDVVPGSEQLIEERFLTVTGHPYFVRTYHRTTGKPATAHETDERGRRTDRQVGGQTGWLADWLTQLAESVPGDAVFICDGPGSAGKVFRIPRRAAATLFMVHNNHYKAPFHPGAPVRTDYGGIFARSAEMDALVVLTQEQATDIASEYPARDVIRVVPNSVDEKAVVTASRDPLRVTMFARMVAQKNVLEAVDVFREVVARVPDATLDIFGAGRLTEALEEHIKETGMGGSVRYRGYATNASAEMAASAAVLCTSLYEGLPVNFLEAYRVGTPVVSYACKYGPKDLVDDGRTGFVVPFGERSLLADRIVEVLQNPDRSQVMGEEGRRTILGRYSNAEVFATWKAVIDESRERLAARR